MSLILGQTGNGMSIEMALNHDPRIDPQPGDVLRLGQKYDHQYFEVLDHDPRYQSTDISFWHVGEGREAVLSLSQWRELMERAEVLLVDTAGHITVAE